MGSAFILAVGINMKVSWLFLFFTALEASTVQDTSGVGIEVKYNHPLVGNPKTCTCTGNERSTEYFDGVPYVRTIHVTCTKTKPADNTDEFVRVRIYSGPDPHDETAYNGDQKLFYQQMLNKIGKKLCETKTTDVRAICEPPLDAEEYFTSTLGKHFTWSLKKCEQLQGVEVQYKTKTCECTGKEVSDEILGGVPYGKTIHVTCTKITPTSDNTPEFVRE